MQSHKAEYKYNHVRLSEKKHAYQKEFMLNSTPPPNFQNKVCMQIGETILITKHLGYFDLFFFFLFTMYLFLQILVPRCSSCEHYTLRWDTDQVAQEGKVHRGKESVSVQGL